MFNLIPVEFMCFKTLICCNISATITVNKLLKKGTNVSSGCLPENNTVTVVPLLHLGAFITFKASLSDLKCNMGLLHLGLMVYYI